MNWLLLQRLPCLLLRRLLLFLSQDFWLRLDRWDMQAMVQLDVEAVDHRGPVSVSDFDAEVPGHPDEQLLSKFQELVLVELNQLGVGSLVSWNILVDISLHFESETARFNGITICQAPVPMDPQPRTVSLLLRVIESAVIVLEIVRYVV